MLISSVIGYVVTKFFILTYPMLFDQVVPSHFIPHFFRTDISTKMITSQFTCDTIVIQGSYKLASGHLLKLILGDVIKIDGYVVATFGKFCFSVSLALVHVLRHKV